MATAFVSERPLLSDSIVILTDATGGIGRAITRLGQPREIAGACAFLLSPLSTFVTGTVLQVNGGSLL
jgi:enoyl-[acyl-carrier-protein] reductase (NADH)